MEQSPKYRRRDGAAQYIREKHNQPCQPKTLAKLAVLGGGPVYCKAGRFPLYQDPDLDVWAESRIGARRLSTSVLLPNENVEGDHSFSRRREPPEKRRASKSRKTTRTSAQATDDNCRRAGRVNGAPESVEARHRADGERAS